MHPADDMYRLFLERERAFQDKTQEVFAHAPYLCDAIVRHLEVNAKDISWLSIDMIGVEIIVMLSIPDDKPTHYVAPGQSPVKVLTIVIPCSVADIGEADPICQFLNETFDIRKYDGERSSEDGYGIVAASSSTRRTVH